MHRTAPTHGLEPLHIAARRAQAQQAELLAEARVRAEAKAEAEAARLRADEKAAELARLAAWKKEDAAAREQMAQEREW